MLSLNNFLAKLVAVTDELPHRKGLVRILYVHKVMGQLQKLLGGRLCSSDVHATIHLHGVGTNKLNLSGKGR